jgi:alpha-glucosidase
VPIPWRPPSEAGPGAGFTTSEPWLPIHPDAEALNVQRQAADPHSTLSLARRLAALRAQRPALQTGARRPRDLGPDVLAWERTSEEERLLAVVNFGTAPVRVATDRHARTLLSSDATRAPGPIEGTLELQPAEAAIVDLTP